MVPASYPSNRALCLLTKRAAWLWDTERVTVFCFRLFRSLVPRSQKSKNKMDWNNPTFLGSVVLTRWRSGKPVGYSRSGEVAALVAGCCPIGFKTRGRTEGAKTNLLNRSKQRKPRKAPHDALPAGVSLLPLLPPFPPVQPAFLSVLCGLAVWDSIWATRRLKIRPLWPRPN